MSVVKDKDFTGKHEPNARVDIAIREELEKWVKNKELACAVAFDIAAGLGVSPAEIGKAADLLNIRLGKCQLGLFGYGTKKKIVKPNPAASRELKDAIVQSLIAGRLPCPAAWEIADRLGVAKMAVSRACEAEGIKIASCQLGAF